MLRHKPWLFELELDAEGWVKLDVFLDVLRGDRSSWCNLTQSDLEQLIASSDKQRFEINNGRIRALYGHSLPGKLIKTPAPPPEILFHGTTDGVVDLILAEGLQPMSRQYVHLSVDTATARQVGSRKKGTLVVLQVAAHRAHQDGIPFYMGNDAVWLADSVPPAYLARYNA